MSVHQQRTWPGAACQARRAQPAQQRTPTAARCGRRAAAQLQRATAPGGPGHGAAPRAGLARHRMHAARRRASQRDIHLKPGCGPRHKASPAVAVGAGHDSHQAAAQQRSRRRLLAAARSSVDANHRHEQTGARGRRIPSRRAVAAQSQPATGRSHGRRSLAAPRGSSAAGSAPSRPCWTAEAGGKAARMPPSRCEARRPRLCASQRRRRARPALRGEARPVPAPPSPYKRAPEQPRSSLQPPRRLVWRSQQPPAAVVSAAALRCVAHVVRATVQHRDGRPTHTRQPHAALAPRRDWLLQGSAARCGVCSAPRERCCQRGRCLRSTPPTPRPLRQARGLLRAAAGGARPAQRPAGLGGAAGPAGGPRSASPPRRQPKHASWTRGRCSAATPLRPPASDAPRRAQPRPRQAWWQPKRPPRAAGTRPADYAAAAQRRSRCRPRWPGRRAPVSEGPRCPFRLRLLRPHGRLPARRVARPRRPAASWRAAAQRMRMRMPVGLRRPPGGRHGGLRFRSAFAPSAARIKARAPARAGCRRPKVGAVAAVVKNLLVAPK